jgi:hypothetical protein
MFTSFSASLAALCALLACMPLFALSGSVVLYSRLTLPIAVSFAVSFTAEKRELVCKSFHCMALPHLSCSLAPSL